MKRVPRAITLLVLLSLAVSCWPVRGGEPPRVLFLGTQLHEAKPPPQAPAYVRKATWYESMRALLEAAFGSTVEKDLAADPSGFRPAMVRLTADAQPVRLEFRVDGLERVYFAALGRPAESGSAQFLSPRLFDKQGNSIPLELGGTLVEGKVDARAARAAELKIDGTTHRGFALVPGEVGFKLDGKYERLEVLVCYARERGLPPYAAVDCRPIFARATECRQVRESLWDAVARDFRDRQSQIEMEIERREGIWNEYLPTGTVAPSAFYLVQAQRRLELARKTLEFVERQSFEEKWPGGFPGRRWLRKSNRSSSGSTAKPQILLRRPDEPFFPRRSTSVAGSSSRTPHSISIGCW